MKGRVKIVFTARAKVCTEIGDSDFHCLQDKYALDDTYKVLLMRLNTMSGDIYFLWVHW